MTPLQSATTVDCLTKAIAVMDEKGRANEEYNSYLLWFEDWKYVRSNLRQALDCVKRDEINIQGL